MLTSGDITSGGAPAAVPQLERQTFAGVVAPLDEEWNPNGDL
jgi:hypothetical protein